MRKRYVFLGFCAVLAAVAFAVPWRSLLEQRLVSVLEERGFGGVSLRVQGIGLYSLQLEAVSFTVGGNPLTLDHLQVQYSPLALLQGQLRQIELKDTHVHWGEMEVSATTLVLDPLQKDEAGNWHGKWELAGISVKGLPVALPPTHASGTIESAAESLAVKGDWGSDDKVYQSQFGLNFMFAKPADSTLTLQHFSMPWYGGVVQLQDAVIPFSGASFALPVKVSHVSVESLLGELTGKQGVATGVVSGVIPLMVRSGEVPLPKGGTLSAESEGKLTMPPEVIPGDHEQIAMLREMLKDFHYKLLALKVDSDAKNGLSVTLAIEGNNPSLYGGKPVKLNVHFSGDVLGFLLQNLATQDASQYLRANERK